MASIGEIRHIIQVVPYIVTASEVIKIVEVEFRRGGISPH